MTTKRKISEIHFNLEDVEIKLSKTIGYLGVWLDTKMKFGEHIDKTVTKASKTLAVLSRLLPNAAGPRASKRRVLVGVIHSQLLYAAPIWYKAMENNKHRQKINSIQRTAAIRVSSAYRTISAEAVRVITGIPPMHLLVQERVETYQGNLKTEARSKLWIKWQEEWVNGKYGRWTYSLIPNIREWVERPYGEVDYYITQALSGHGCFKSYLFNRTKSPTNHCVYCNELDDAQHTLFECPRWSVLRHQYYIAMSIPFTAETMMNSLKGGEKNWTLAYTVIKGIIKTKEEEARRNT